MTNKVSRLDEASHTVRLAAGAISDGMRNGNMLTPAVAMMPKMPSALEMNAMARRPDIGEEDGKQRAEEAEDGRGDRPMMRGVMDEPLVGQAHNGFQQRIGRAVGRDRAGNGVAVDAQPYPQAANRKQHNRRRSADLDEVAAPAPARRRRS